MIKRRLLVAATLFCLGCDPNPPRRAYGCSDPTPAIPLVYVVQDSTDQLACVRLDLRRDEGSIEVPGIRVTGGWQLVTAIRVTSACDHILGRVRILELEPSATRAERGTGHVDLEGSTVADMAVDLEFAAAPDGSLDPSTIYLSAAGVETNEPCPLP